MTGVYVSPALATTPLRSLSDIRLQLIERRVKLLIQQINARAEARYCERELAAIERRLRMVESADA